MLLRLCHLPCEKPLAFRQALNSSGGCAARGEASSYGANGKPEAFRTGTRQSRNQLIADEYGSRVSKGRKTQRGSGEIELTIYNEGV